jgi:peptidoglycan/xylan/chitin deacetylase (PgdA/CDA1 family)
MDGPEIYRSVDDAIFPSHHDYLAESTRNAIKILDVYNLKAIFFIVGKDLEQNPQFVSQIRLAIQHGHLIGNHSYSHREDFHKLDPQDQFLEMQKTDIVITKKLGVKAHHYRGPGYSTNSFLQKEMLALGYRFDCTPVPLAFTAFLNGYFKFFTASNKPFPTFYSWKDLSFAFRKKKIIQEIRIHPRKLLGVPIYSTLLFSVARNDFALEFLKNRLNAPFLMHSIDFLETSEVSDKIPALSLSSIRRREIITLALDRVQKLSA